MMFPDRLLGIVILATAALFVPLRIEHPFVMVLFLVLTAVTFSLFGFIIGLWADGFEKLQLVPLLIVTPLTLTWRSCLRFDPTRANAADPPEGPYHLRRPRGPQCPEPDNMHAPFPEPRTSLSLPSCFSLPFRAGLSPARFAVPVRALSARSSNCSTEGPSGRDRMARSS